MLFLRRRQVIKTLSEEIIICLLETGVDHKIGEGNISFILKRKHNLFCQGERKINGLCFVGFLCFVKPKEVCYGHVPVPEIIGSHLWARAPNI